MAKDDPYATFRPVGGRIVPLVVAGLCVMIFTVVAIALPSEGKPSFSVGDKTFIWMIGVGFALVLWRFAQVRAIPTQEGIEVHNLVVTRQVAWSQIVEVQFGGGQAWAVLELDDFDTLPVMGIQRSDGPRATAEAQRLAALVEAHTRRGPEAEI